MNDDFINEGGFDCFFTENDMLRQHCHLLETELTELHGELKESRGKIATLVLMWSGVSRELARAEMELRQARAALELAAHDRPDCEAAASEIDRPTPVAFDLTCSSPD